MYQLITHTKLKPVKRLLTCFINTAAKTELFHNTDRKYMRRLRRKFKSHVSDLTTLT